MISGYGQTGEKLIFSSITIDNGKINETNFAQLLVDTAVLYSKNIPAEFE